MGGAAIQKEPGSIEALEKFPKACQIFKDVGWFGFFERLEGSNKVISMEFAKNLEKNQTKVRGLKLKVTKEVIS